MTRIEALKELIAKVEAGDAGPEDFDWTSEDWPRGLPSASCARAYIGSLDAAMALHEAVLPGWLYSIENDATCVFTDDILNAEVGQYDGKPARAWLIAILKALISKEEA